MKLVRPTLCALSLFFVTEPGFGAGGPEAFEGRYVAGSKSYSQELEISRRSDGGYEVKALVATRGCTGDLDAQGAVAGDALITRKTAGGEACTLVIRRNGRGLRVEEESCMSHGAACGFSGDYRRR